MSSCLRESEIVLIFKDYIKNEYVKVFVLRGNSLRFETNNSWMFLQFLLQSVMFCYTDRKYNTEIFVVQSRIKKIRGNNVVCCRMSIPIESLSIFGSEAEIATLNNMRSVCVSGA